MHITMSHWNWKKGACCFGVWSVAAGRLVMCSWVWVQGYSWIKDLLGRGGGHYFSYNLLNEIQTMFSQLAQRSWVLPADWRPDYAHYVKKHRLTVLRRNKNIAAHGGTVPHYCIFVVRKFCRFSDIVCRFLFLLKNFPLQSLEYATYGCV